MKNEVKEEMSTIQVFKKDLGLIERLRRQTGSKTNAILMRKLLLAYLRCGVTADV